MEKQRKKRGHNPFEGATRITEHFKVERKQVEWEFLPDPRYSSQVGEQNYVGNFLDKKRVILFLGILAALFIILVGKLYYIQIIEGQEYRDIAEGNRTKRVIIKAARGLFLDRNGMLLVQNIPGFVAALKPNEIPRDLQRDTYLNRLALTLGTDKKDIENALKEKENSVIPVIIAENIDYEKAILLAVKEQEFPGLLLEAVSYRKYYPLDSVDYPKSLSHILGYTGIINTEEYAALKEKNYSFTDYLGKTGLEANYEERVKGKNGLEETEIDAFGRAQKVYQSIPPVSGENITLSLDVRMQKKAEEILLSELDKQKKSRGAMIIVDPRNGEILSLVSVPFYDNNKFSPKIHISDYESLLLDPDKPLFNRGISGAYPSGSTIKPIIAFTALQNGIITPQTTVLSVGGIAIGQWFFPDWRAGGHGPVNVYSAIAQSVNTFFYYIGGGYNDFQGLGIEKMVQGARLFGLGEKLGIDLPSEVSGFLPTPEWKKEIKNEPWYIGDSYHFAIGQGDVLVTPLQVAAFTAVFANFGTLFQPHLIKDESQDFVVQKIDSPHIGTVRQAMREAVLSGSARRLQNLPVTSAGKTGTAQWNSKKPEHAWFTSFAPYENPELAVTVLIEEGGGGEKSALPVAYKFYNWYFGEYKNLKNSI